MLCKDSLEDSGHYPSYVLLIDADGSGNCTPEDRFVLGQFYGWNADIDATLTAEYELEKVGDRITWGEKSFCDYYVPAGLLK